MSLSVNEQGTLIHQVYVVGKEEGERIIESVKVKAPRHEIIAKLEEINNKK